MLSSPTITSGGPLGILQARMFSHVLSKAIEIYSWPEWQNIDEAFKKEKFRIQPSVFGQLYTGYRMKGNIWNMIYFIFHMIINPFQTFHFALGMEGFGRTLIKNV